MIDLKIKKKLYDHCVNCINDKIAAIDDEMRSIQSSANEETKSSAGDRYETSRAMMMLEKEKFASQMEEIVECANRILHPARRDKLLLAPSALRSQSLRCVNSARDVVLALYIR